MFRYLALIVCAYSLYQDQIGAYDWHKRSIGKISEIWLAPKSKSIALSERGVLSLLSSSGEIEWRRIINHLDSKPIGTISPSAVFTYSDKTLTAWTIQDGLIIWSQSFKHLKQVFYLTFELSEYLVGLNSKYVEFFSTENGETMRKFDLNNTSKILGKNQDFLIIAGTKMNFWKIHLKTWDIETIEGKAFEEVFCGKESCLSVENNYASVYQNGKVKEIPWSLAEISYVFDSFYVLKDDSMVEIQDFVPVVYKNFGLHVASINSLMWANQSIDGIIINRPNTEPIAIKNTGKLPRVLKLWSYSNKKEEVLGFLLLEDYRVICFKDNSIKWTREESLGHINSVYFMELPSTEMHLHNQYFAYIKDHNDWKDIFSNFMLRVQSQIMKPVLEQTELEKDSFAIKKLLLVLSDSGYILAIQSLTSQIVWRLRRPDVLSIIQTESEEALIISKVFSKTELAYINILTGQVTSTEFIYFDVKNLIKTEKDEKVQISLMDQNLSLLQIRKNKPESLYFYVINTTTNTIEGYEHKSNNTKTWSLLISKTEKIKNFITNKSGKIHQPAIATGTSRLIYKYADENLFAISTQKGSDLYVYIINSISGHIIYRLHQDFVAGSVHLAFSEHKLYVHYWNEKSETFEIISIELFKSNVDDFAGDVLRTYYSGKFTNEYSSRFTPEITVFTQTYTFPFGVKDMKITTTHQGITKPFLVMILENNQVYLLDTSLLSPRRKLEDSHD